MYENLFCLYGDVPKWLKGPDSKSGRSVLPALGFKSLHLRHLKTPLESEPLWVGLNGVFYIIPVFKRLYKVDFLFCYSYFISKNAKTKYEKI